MDDNIKNNGLKKIAGLLRMLFILCLIIAVICFGMPMMRKKASLSKIGESVANELSAFSTALSYFAEDSVDHIKTAGKTDEEYKQVAGLFNQVSTQKNYEGMYLLSRDNEKRYIILVDSFYSDKGKAGTDYYKSLTQYPLDTYKSANKLLDNLYTGKSSFEYAKDIIVLPNQKQVAVVYLPVYGANRTVLSILAIESDPGDTAYANIGVVNLTYVGGGALALCVIFALILIIMSKINKNKQNKLIREKAEEEAKEALLQAQPPEADSQDTQDSKEN